MKITIVSRIYWPEPSAASSFLSSIAAELTRRGDEVTVLTTRVPGPQPGSQRPERIVRWPVLRDASGYVRGYLQYASFDVPLAIRLLLMRRPDVVFVEPPPTTGAVVRMVCAIRRIRYVYDLADIWSDAARNATSSTLVVRVLRAVERFALSGASALVTISQPVADRVAALGVQTDTHVTGFGADTETFFAEPQPAPHPTFVYGGTYSELHGASIFVRSFAAVAAAHPGSRLRFIGNGTQRAELESLAHSLGIADSVEFAPPLDEAELATELNQAWAALASLSPEAQYDYAITTKAYSALASGCPVLFTGPGPTRELLDSATAGTWLGEAVGYDTPAVTAAMVQIASTPASLAQRRHIARWAHEHHSLRRVAERVADVVEGVGHAQKRTRRNLAETTSAVQFSHDGD